MHPSLRLLLVMLVVASTGGTPLLGATTTSKGKKSSKPETDSPAVKKTPPPPSEPVNEDPPTSVPTPAAVSTLSIEDIRGFDQYPKQIQSLVQSCLALTHLELGYMYGSSEPSKGGMDCSGTIYHVLHFQGLKDVPRQSDEMCQWVDKKSHLSLTPTATSFDSEEFKDLKPGDLLFWTNAAEKTRKLPVTHVMVYLGKLKKNGKRIVFGSSDGRSYMGERRSGVSVFDFSLPKPDSTKHFYGYGPAPGLVPVEPEQPVIAAATPASATKEASAPNETAVSKEAPTPKETAVVKESSAPKMVAKSKAADTDKETATLKVASLTKEMPASKEPTAVKEPPAAPKEEVRKAVAVTNETPPDAATQKMVIAKAKTEAPSKSTTTAKPKSTATKKRSTTLASTTRRRTPAAPPKSVIEQKVERAVSSVRRFFQQ